MRQVAAGLRAKVRALLPEQAWSSGWWSAEREEALRALDELMDAPGAWQPLPALFSDGGDAADPGEADGPNRCPTGSHSFSVRA